MSSSVRWLVQLNGESATLERLAQLVRTRYLAVEQIDGRHYASSSEFAGMTDRPRPARPRATRMFRVLTTLALLAAVAFTACGGDDTSAPQASTTPFSWAVDDSTTTDNEALKTATRDILSDHPMSLANDQTLTFVGLLVSGEWAISEALASDGSHSDIPDGESLILLYRKTEAAWKAAYPGTPEFEAWIDEMPTELIASESRYLFK